MRKETKQKIFVAFIIGTFLLSSVAYFATGATGLTTNNQQPKQLTNFVVEGELDQVTEYAYLSNGFTIIKVYSSEFPAFVDALPGNTQTSYGQTQLIVEKIISDSNYASVIGPYGERVIDNLTEQDVFITLCESLAYTPVECGLLNIPSGPVLPA